MFFLNKVHEIQKSQLRTKSYNRRNVNLSSSYLVLKPIHRCLARRAYTILAPIHKKISYNKFCQAYVVCSAYSPYRWLTLLS